MRELWSLTWNFLHVRLLLYARIYSNRRNSFKFMLLISNSFVFKLFPLMWIGLKLFGGKSFSSRLLSKRNIPSDYLSYIIDHVQQISLHSITFAFDVSFETLKGIWTWINKSLDLRNIYKISVTFSVKEQRFKLCVFLKHARRKHVFIKGDDEEKWLKRFFVLRSFQWISSKRWPPNFYL